MIPGIIATDIARGLPSETLTVLPFSHHPRLQDQHDLTNYSTLHTHRVTPVIGCIDASVALCNKHRFARANYQSEESWLCDIANVSSEPDTLAHGAIRTCDLDATASPQIFVTSRYRSIQSSRHDYNRKFSFQMVALPTEARQPPCRTG